MVALEYALRVSVTDRFGDSQRESLCLIGLGIVGECLYWGGSGVNRRMPVLGCFESDSGVPVLGWFESGSRVTVLG